MSVTEQPLPAGIRRVTITALLLSALMGFGAAQGIAALLEPPDAAELDFSHVQPLPMLQGDPALYQHALKAMALAQLAAYQSMRGSRTLILIALSVTSALVFVSALRMLQPRGAPREGVRQLLGTATLVTAVLRTLEGAQAAAVAKRAGSAFDKILSVSGQLPAEWPKDFMAAGYTAMSMCLSLLVGGGLVLLSLYFRSEKVREVTTRLDGPSASP